MLSTVHIVETTFATINGKLHHVCQFGMSVKDILRRNPHKDVYIYKPTLNDPRPRGFIAPPNN